LAPAPNLDSMDQSRIGATVFLIGDAGDAKEDDRVLVELARQGKLAPRSSAIVFLGDNVYPRGIPAADDPGRADAERKLFRQAALADSTGLPVYFIPGNHDWAMHRREGWSSVQRADFLLRAYGRQRKLVVEQRPYGGCPGPSVINVGERLRVVTVNTHWWLHGWLRPGYGDEKELGPFPGVEDPIEKCPLTTEVGVADSLRRIFQSDDRRVYILAGHHPLQSHGEHGGFYPRVTYLLPLIPTGITPWLWVPIGWVIPLLRTKGCGMTAKVVKSLRQLCPQDEINPMNRAMRTQIEGTFSDRHPLIYVAGHEHALEVLRRGPNRYLLVSGAGMENHQTLVWRGDSTIYSSDRPGFMRVDLLPSDSVRIGVTVIDRDRKAGEVYHAWLKPNVVEAVAPAASQR